MTNLRRVATAIYDTGDSERVLKVLGLLLQIGLDQSNNVDQEVGLICGQIVRVNVESHQQPT